MGGDCVVQVYGREYFPHGVFAWPPKAPDDLHGDEPDWLMPLIFSTDGSAGASAASSSDVAPMAHSPVL